jgi:hypothetical protein
MNERNKELYQMAVKSASAELHEWNKNWQPSNPNFEYEKVLYKKFAELVVRECKENFGKVWYEQGLDIRGAELDKFMTRFEQHFGVK